jgi:hypothetical protein
MESLNSLGKTKVYAPLENRVYENHDILLKVRKLRKSFDEAKNLYQVEIQLLSEQDVTELKSFINRLIKQKSISESERDRYLNEGGEKTIIIKNDGSFHFTQLSRVVRLPPLHAAVFAIFLLNSQTGLKISELKRSDKKIELTKRYSFFRPNADANQCIEAVERLISPKTNSIHEKLSVIRKEVRRALGCDLNYSIVGDKGCPKLVPAAKNAQILFS